MLKFVAKAATTANTEEINYQTTAAGTFYLFVAPYCEMLPSCPANKSTGKYSLTVY